jgi:murein DD-endopeptidase MepM/ murein hydrolase activator NlpD
MFVMPGRGVSQGAGGFCPRRRRPSRRALSARSLALTGLGAAAITLAAAVLAPLGGWADVSSDQSQIAQLQEKIAQDGAQVQSLVAASDVALAKVSALDAEVAQTEAALVADQHAEAQALSNLRSIAIDGYMDAGEYEPGLALFETGGDASSARTEYSRLAGDRLRFAIDAVRTDERKTQSSHDQLERARDAAATSTSQLIADRQAAQAALNTDNTVLDGVQSNLQALLAAAAAAQEAGERAQEAALATPAQPNAPAKTPPPPPTPHPVPLPPSYDPTPGSYANPLRDVIALVPERIDQGVDYSGFGPIYAVGDGVVLSTVNAGWPGGTFISYRLTDGAAAGLVVYAAEDIDPTVSVGQAVTSGTALGLMYEGPSGIETGWADPSGDGVSMANDAGQFSGANSTAFGANFSQLQASLGAPPGVLQNDPPTGSLPSGWPSW